MFHIQQLENYYFFPKCNFSAEYPTLNLVSFQNSGRRYSGEEEAQVTFVEHVHRRTFRLVTYLFGLFQLISYTFSFIFYIYFFGWSLYRRWFFRLVFSLFYTRTHIHSFRLVLSVMHHGFMAFQPFCSRFQLLVCE